MATVTQRRGYYILNFSDEKGRHRVSLGRVGVLPERQVQSILKAKQLELSTGARLLGQPLSRALNFGQYVREYLAWHEGEYPHSHYRVRQILNDHLLPRFQYLPLDMIAAREVEQFKQERLRQAEPGTVIKELRTLKAVINRALREGVIYRDPIATVKPPRDLHSKPHRFYESDELARIYAACSASVNSGEGPQPDPLHAAMWRLFANTGMRRGEGLALKRRWVGTDGMKIVSTGEERTKSGEWREIPLTKGARAALEELPKGEHVIPRMTPPSLSRAFVRDARRAGLDGSLHTLRHTYISHLVRTGVPLRTVQLYAGHAHYSTTEQYAYLAPGKPMRQVTALNL